MSHDIASPVGDMPRRDGTLLGAYSCLVRGVCRAAMVVAAVLIIVDLVLIGAEVVLRYVLSSPLQGGDEVVAFSLTAIVMLAAPDVLRRDGHIGVDVLVGLLPARAAPWVAVWSSVSVLLVSALLIVNGRKATAFSRMIGQLTEGHLELPVWWLQALLPLGGILLALPALEMLWRAIARILHPGAKGRQS